MKRTRTLLTILAAGLLYVVHAASSIAPGNYYLYFDTQGADCYADGSPLLEGERYALVWRSEALKDVTTGLFNANGTPVDPTNCNIVAIFPSAVREGTGDNVFAHAAPSVCEVPRRHLVNIYEQDRSEPSGVYSVFAFDTRVWKNDAWTLGQMKTVSPNAFATDFTAEYASNVVFETLRDYTPVNGLTALTVNVSLNSGIARYGSVSTDYSFTN